ncbi:MAG: hypothetical protein JWN44_4401 [Myxococcales bacterium]|nr:hypothetical protein [Myxococcales bacterium]
MIISREPTTEEACACGCGVSFRSFRGQLELHGSTVAFIAQLRTHGDDAAAWAALVFARDNESAWVTVRARIVGDNLHIGMVDPSRSPFLDELARRSERAMTRADVTASEALRRRVTEAGATVMRDPEIYEFLLQSRGAVTPA